MTAHDEREVMTRRISDEPLTEETIQAMRYLSEEWEREGEPSDPPEDEPEGWYYDEEAQAALTDIEDKRCPSCGEHHSARLDCDGTPHDPDDVCPTCRDPDCFRPVGHPLDEYDLNEYEQGPSQ